MSRYFVNKESNPPGIEALPKGTPRTEGVTFAEAKRDFTTWLRRNGDLWYAAAKLSRQITRADVKAGRNLALLPGTEPGSEQDEQDGQSERDEEE
jgi:hypothetical protein